MVHLMALGGTEKTLLKQQKKSLFQENVNVSNAGIILYLKNQKDFLLNIAATFVVKERVKKLIPDKISILSFAWYAEHKKMDKNQGLDFVHKAVKIEEESCVYNLTVKDANCYYANGLLVHNCDALARITEDEGKYAAGTDKKIVLVLQWPKSMMQERTKRERPNWRL
jgi:hypothetical protein